MKKEKAEALRRRYPAGTGIILKEMEGEPQMKAGLKGTVMFVDDAGQIHVDWENGSTLALVENVDCFDISDREGTCPEQTQHGGMVNLE